MIKRVAFFTKKNEIENVYGVSTQEEHLFEAHYNLSPGQPLPVVVPATDHGQNRIDRIRWGSETHGESPDSAILPAQDVNRELKTKKVQRCIVPLSGFYIWKEQREKDHPFFVRMLNKPFMSAGGLFYQDEAYVKLVVTESNTLVQPISATMLLLLDHTLAHQWLTPEFETPLLLQKSKDSFLLTDLSVLRVSKNVNDPGNNSPDLIQPIPK